MADIGIFGESVFETQELSDRVTLMPHVPGRIGELGLFETKGIRTTDLAIEMKNNTLSLIPYTDRDAPDNIYNGAKRKLVRFETGHFPLKRVIRPSEIQNIRAFGDVTELEDAQSVVDEKMGEMVPYHDATLEFQRLGALKGYLLDSNGVDVVENLLVDCAQFREDAAGDEYIRGKNWERAINAEDVCEPGSDASQSATRYDRRTSYVKNDSLKSWDADAQAWAKAYLTKNAVPPVRARLSLSHEAVQIVDPLDGLLVRVSGLAVVIPDAYPARVSFDFSDPARKVQIDLGGEQPTLARFLASGRNGQGQSVSAGGGGGVSVSSAVSSAIADLLPGVYAGQDVASEVVDARSRYAISGPNGFVAYTYTSLKNHVNALWTALAKRTADPNGKPANQILATDGNNSVAFVDPSTIAAGVTSVNGAEGAITLAEGPGISIDEDPVGTLTISATGGGGGGGYDGHVDVQLLTADENVTGSGAVFAKRIVYGDSATSVVVHFVHAITDGGPNFYGDVLFLNISSHAVSLVLDSYSHWGNGGPGPTLAPGEQIWLFRPTSYLNPGAVWYRTASGSAG